MPAAVLVARSLPRIATASPRLAGSVALRLFFRTDPRMPVRTSDRPTHDAARRSRVRVRGTEVVTYSWGRGPRTALLLHGWRGRASQFAPLVRELVSEGFRVVTFDAPAHGASPGRRTDIRDWVAVGARLQADHGAFDLIVGHSFGALAALTIARRGPATSAVVAVAGASAPDAFLAQFVRDLRLDPPTAERLAAGFRRRMTLDRNALTREYDAVRHPLPAGTSLLVIHDRDDRRMPDDDALRLHAAHGERSRLLRTDGLGHTRVLSADVTLDAVVALATGGLGALAALGTKRGPDAESAPIARSLPRESAVSAPA